MNIKSTQANSEDHKRKKILFQRILDHFDEIKELKERLDGDWGLTERFYRMYHQSFKVYRVQAETQKCLELFQKIAGLDFTINEWFLQLVREGTGHEFDMSHNQNWLEHTRPMMEATLHAKFFLDLFVRHKEDFEKKEIPSVVSFGLATVLYLFNER